MAAVKSTRALSVTTDGSDANAVFNVDTTNKVVSLPNGASLNFYSDAYSTLTQSYGPNGKAPLVSATSPDPGAAGTIATAGVDVARVTPVAAEAGVILQAGTVNGKSVLIINEAVQADTLTFDAVGTSNVADGVNDILVGGQAANYIWDSSIPAWVREANPLISGGLTPTIASATAPDPGASGTVVTAGIGRSRVAPASNRASCILAAGTFDGQEVWVVNEGASSVSWATAATSHIAGETGGTFVLAAGGAQKFVYSSGDSKWHKAS